MPKNEVNVLTVKLSGKRAVDVFMDRETGELRCAPIGYVDPRELHAALLEARHHLRQIGPWAGRPQVTV